MAASVSLMAGGMVMAGGERHGHGQGHGGHLDCDFGRDATRGSPYYFCNLNPTLKTLNKVLDIAN